MYWRPCKISRVVKWADGGMYTEASNIISSFLFVQMSPTTLVDWYILVYIYGFLNELGEPPTYTTCMWRIMRACLRVVISNVCIRTLFIVGRCKLGYRLLEYWTYCHFRGILRRRRARIAQFLWCIHILVSELYMVPSLSVPSTFLAAKQKPWFDGKLRRKLRPRATQILWCSFLTELVHKRRPFCD